MTVGKLYATLDHSHFEINGPYYMTIEEKEKENKMVQQQACPLMSATRQTCVAHTPNAKKVLNYQLEPHLHVRSSN